MGTRSCYKAGYAHGALDGKVLAVQADSFDLVERVGSEVAFPTMRARNHRHILNRQQVIALPKGLCDPVNARPLFSANVTSYFVFHIEPPLRWTRLRHW